MGVATNLKAVKDGLPSHVTLVAVSKTKPDELIMEAYEAGHRDFGENRVQDLAAKAERLPADIRWHMIGHLQTNKVKYIASFVHMVHGVDSLKLLTTIDREAAKHDRVIDCLLQLRIASEESKFGLPEQELEALLESPEYLEMKNIRIRGLMGMATFTDDLDQVRAEFRELFRIFEISRAAYFASQQHFDRLSFGMSGDYQVAIEEGSNMVRVGSLIFGARQKL